jgi:hypothetical protein
MLFPSPARITKSGDSQFDIRAGKCQVGAGFPSPQLPRNQLRPLISYFLFTYPSLLFCVTHLLLSLILFFQLERGNIEANQQSSFCRTLPSGERMLHIVCDDVSKRNVQGC